MCYLYMKKTIQGDNISHRMKHFPSKRTTVLQKVHCGIKDTEFACGIYTRNKWMKISKQIQLQRKLFNYTIHRCENSKYNFYILKVIHDILRERLLYETSINYFKIIS